MKQEQTQQTDTADDTIITPKEQVRQARLVLMQIQWLVIVLLIGAVVWLRYNQSQLITQVENRLKVTEEFNQRLNNIDDKLFALTPAIARSTADTNAVNNDLQLIAVQLSSANRLYESGDYQGTDEVLKSVQYQLGTDRLSVSGALAAALKQALAKDIEYLDSAKVKPDDWQVHMLTIRQVQSYLNKQLGGTQSINTQALTVRDVNSALSLALIASRNKDREMLTAYLQEALTGLEHLDKLMPQTQTQPQTPATDKQNQNTVIERKDKVIESTEDAIFAVNELLANRPKHSPLASPQILKTSKATQTQ
ncbi:MAG: hypothetical protein Q4G13_06300 [Moraxella sp.]|nr:hypothetical protein [Moraxella sp.]